MLAIIYDRIDEGTLKIWGISDDNAVYVSPETVYAAEVKSGREGVFICWTLAAGYWLFAAFFCYILDHAEEYPRIAMLLVKKDDLNI